MRELDGDNSRLREARIENTIRSVVDQVRKACFGSPVGEDRSFSINRLPVPSLPENLVDERCIPLSPNRNGAAVVPRDSRPLTSSSPVFFGDMELPFATTDLHQPPLVDTGLTQLSPMALPGLMQPPSSSRIDALPASVLGSPFNSVSGFASMKDQSNDIMLCYNGDLPSAANVDMISLMHAGLMGESNTVRPMDSNLHTLTCNELYSFTRPNLVQLTGENGHQGFSKILNSLEIPNSYSLVVPASNSSELNDPSVSEENNNLSPLRTYITPTLLSVNGQEQQSSVTSESPLSHQHSLSRPASVAPASRDLPTCGNNISLLIVGPSSAANFRCANDKQGNSTVAPSRKRKRSHSTSAADAEDNSYIDTKELCERISYELRSHTISQATFAARVLNRSQGTLSDLLRNPKPWNVLKSGRETFRRMYNWLQLPLVARMQMFDSSSSSEENQNDMTSSSASKKEPTTATKAKVAASRERQCRVTSTFVSEEDLADARARLTKKRRLVFSESQKKALNAVFRVKPRPSRRVQEVVARCLDLSRSTVQNFFMNARRRSRPNAQLVDQPLSHQVVRPISPPPPLPKGPVREPSTRRQGNNSSSNMSTPNTTTTTAGAHSTDEATTDDEFDPLVLLVLEMVRSEEDRLAGENPLSTTTSAAASPLNDSA
ncbi:hypothetical protein M513_04874 [Trichuris suis]|uniref:One cut domain family member n=1 Tax=Trichuris suis TaxID=68888 RepID=A0A085MAT6_9BILA|nr:hypothetical protein M513_04874 [Trichuris suis]